MFLVIWGLYVFSKLKDHWDELKILQLIYFELVSSISQRQSSHKNLLFFVLILIFNVEGEWKFFSFVHKGKYYTSYIFFIYCFFIYKSIACSKIHRFLGIIFWLFVH